MFLALLLGIVQADFPLENMGKEGWKKFADVGLFFPMVEVALSV